MQLLDAAKDGTLIVRHPHTYLPYRPKQYCEYFERVRVSDLNRYFEAAGASWRLRNGDETADRLFEKEWWNLYQVLARVCLRESAVVREGASFGSRVIEEATNSPTVCYLSFAEAQEALIEALQTRKLTAYGLKNGEDGLTEIPALQWADPTFLWNPDRVYDSCLEASRWTALRFRRKDILALWPGPLHQPDDQAPAAEERAPPVAGFGESTVPEALSERTMRDKPRTRRTMIRVVVEAARDGLLAKHGQEPGIDEVFRELQVHDSTGTIVDYTDDKLVWTDTKGKHHDIKRKSLANLLSNIRKTG